MTIREYMVYEWTCDGCGETEVDEVEGIPDGWETPDEGDFCRECSAGVDVVLPPEERCEACVAEAFAITSASDPHTCALRLPPDSTPAGLRVEIHEGIGSVTTCKVWRDGVLVFDGVDRSVLLSTPPAGGAS